MHPFNFSGCYHAVRAFLGLKSKPPLPTIASEDHAYVRGPPEGRSPCPGLNILANHGYLYVSVSLRHRLH